MFIKQPLSRHPSTAHASKLNFLIKALLLGISKSFCPKVFCAYIYTGVFLLQITWWIFNIGELVLNSLICSELLFWVQLWRAGRKGNYLEGVARWVDFVLRAHAAAADKIPARSGETVFSAAMAAANAIPVPLVSPTAPSIASQPLNACNHSKITELGHFIKIEIGYFYWSKIII